MKGLATVAALAAGFGLGVLVGLVVGDGGGGDDRSAEVEAELRRVNEALRARLRRVESAAAPQLVRRRRDAARGDEEREPDQAAEAERSAATAVTAADVDALLARAEATREAREKEAFTRALYDLAATKHPRAQRYLLEIAADESLLFPKDTIGNEYLTWFRDSELPGIAEIVRRRFEVNWNSPTHRWNAANGWLELLARHARDEDIDWLAGLDRTNRLRTQAFEALAHAEPRQIVPLIERLRRIDPTPAEVPRLVFGFAHNHPEQAYEFLDPLVRRALAGEDVGLGLPAKELLRTFGDLVPASAVDDLPSLILSAESEETRVGGVYLAQRLADRNIDISGFARVLQIPAMMLRRVAAEAPDAPGSAHALYTAMYAVEYNRVAWTEENVAAMELAAREASVGPTDGLAENAKRIRAEMQSGWR